METQFFVTCGMKTKVGDVELSGDIAYTVKRFDLEANKVVVDVYGRLVSLDLDKCNVYKDYEDDFKVVSREELESLFAIQKQ